jgi:hypothetical protein
VSRPALRAPRSRSKSLDTGLCASAYYSAIRGMSDSSSTNLASILKLNEDVRGSIRLAGRVGRQHQKCGRYLGDAEFYVA